MFVVAQGAEGRPGEPSGVDRVQALGPDAGGVGFEAAAAVVGVDERQYVSIDWPDSERAVASSSPKSTLTNVVAPWRRAPMDATP